MIFYSLTELGNIVKSIDASNFVDVGTAAYGLHYLRAPIQSVMGEDVDRLLNSYIQ